MKHSRKDYNSRIVDLAMDIPGNEPVFLLRGQDKFAAIAVRAYADAIEKEMGSEYPVVESAREHADLMDQWMKKKVPDFPVGPEKIKNIDEALKDEIREALRNKVGSGPPLIMEDSAAIRGPHEAHAEDQSSHGPRGGIGARAISSYAERAYHPRSPFFGPWTDEEKEILSGKSKPASPEKEVLEMVGVPSAPAYLQDEIGLIESQLIAGGVRTSDASRLRYILDNREESTPIAAGSVVTEKDTLIPCKRHVAEIKSDGSIVFRESDEVKEDE